MGRKYRVGSSYISGNRSMMTTDEINEPYPDVKIMCVHVFSCRVIVQKFSPLLFSVTWLSLSFIAQGEGDILNTSLDQAMQSLCPIHQILFRSYPWAPIFAAPFLLSLASRAHRRAATSASRRACEKFSRQSSHSQVSLSTSNMNVP